MTVVAEAAIRPSFDTDECAFNATHIVVATEGEKIDGALDVLESWKGDLKKGDRITVPELAGFASDEARTVHSGFLGTEESAKPVSGSRMVLFLVKTPLLVGPAPKPEAPPTRERERWDSANGQGLDMNVSVAWIEDGEAYAFVQVMNPGPSLLVQYGKEKDLKARALHVVEVRAAVDNALATPGTSERSKALAAFSDSDAVSAKCLSEAYDKLARVLTATVEGENTDLIWTSRNYSFWCRRPILIPVFGEMGPKAAPILADTLQHGFYMDRYYGALVKALAGADSEAARPVLISMLQSEISYWKDEAARLKEGRIDADEPETPPFRPFDDTPPLRYRCWKMVEALNALANMHPPEAEAVVRGLRDFWRATPVLERDLPQISERCDAVLASITKK